jgi:CheY-like chemotaxis protein
MEEKTNILIVDDDKTFLLSLSDGLSSHDSMFNILTAGNGKEAVEELKENIIDLVITDLKMPEMDGFELMAFMSRNYPHIPVIVITAFGTPEIEKNLKSLGTFQYLEKPLDFNVLIERISEGLESKSSGYIKGISLPSFLQLVEMEKKTCTLMVKSKGRKGYLFFNNGILMDAETGKQEGEEAAYDIVSWDNAEIAIDGKCKRKKNINALLSFIVMEAYRKRDESAKRDKEADDEGNVEFDISYDENEESTVFTLDDSTEEIKDIKSYSKVLMHSKKVIEELREDLRTALITTDVWTVLDGQSIAGFNPKPKACALFNQITSYIIEALNASDYPELGKYYIFDLIEEKMVIIIPLPQNDFVMGMLIDTNKAQMGLLLNIIIPKIIESFEKALKD